MMSKTSKRIDNVTVRRIHDDDAETDDLGTFADSPGDYAIVHAGEYQGEFVSDLPCTCEHSKAEHDDDDACTVCRGNDDGCDYFETVDIARGREFRYFNPNANNYAGEPDEDIRKYCLQDYNRARTFGDQWSYIGIRAQADVYIDSLRQTLTSGGLWGVETDSDQSYFAEIAQEELSQLRQQLHAIGFTKRAISAAFRDVKDEND